MTLTSVAPFTTVLHCALASAAEQVVGTEESGGTEALVAPSTGGVAASTGVAASMGVAAFDGGVALLVTVEASVPPSEVAGVLEQAAAPRTGEHAED